MTPWAEWLIRGVVGPTNPAVPGLPSDPRPAGRRGAGDVGHADERLFLNNVSLGVYARLVHRREAHRHRRKAFARIRASAILLTHRQPLGITPVEFRIEPRALRVLVPPAESG